MAKKQKLFVGMGQLDMKDLMGFFFFFMAMLIISGQVVFTSSLSCTDLNYSVQSATKNKQKTKLPVPLILVLPLENAS